MCAGMVSAMYKHDMVSIIIIRKRMWQQAQVLFTSDMKEPYCSPAGYMLVWLMDR